jgi:hypothetical protein
MENHKLIISPKTKVLQLIETYPHLEDVLINCKTFVFGLIINL